MPSSRTPKRKSAHERLLEAAAVLFYNDGIAGTGIDAIVERAGVAKKSLYNNFSSKADLVNQYIEARHAEWLDLYQARLRTAATPEEKILAVFDAYQDHAEDAYERGFRGCGLLNAAAELTAGDAGRQAVRIHKEEVEAILLSELQALLPNDKARALHLARHLSFLLEGSIARAGLEGGSSLLLDARSMASGILETL